MKDPPTLRVLAYNLRSLRDDRAALVRVIRACAPDVACLSEAPRLLGWRRRTAALARDTQLYVVAGGRDAAGTLLLCAPRLQVRGAGSVLFPRRPGLHQRGYAWADFELSGWNIRAVACHLGLDAAERLDHAAALGALDPDLLAGDLNEPPTGAARRLLGRHLHDPGAGPSFPAAAPSARIDAVLAGEDLTIRDLPPPPTPDLAAASDHLPVLAEVTPRRRRADRRRPRRPGPASGSPG